MKKQEKGLTLIELVISSFILLMLLYAMYDIFIHGLLIWKKGSLRQDNEQKSIVVTNRLFYEIRLTALSSITTFTYDGSSISNNNYSSTALELENDSNANNSISFRTPVDPDTGKVIPEETMGKLRWQSYLIYYTRVDPKNLKKNILCQKIISLGSRRGEVNSCPLESFISGKSIIDYINDTSIEQRVVCRDIIKTCFRRNLSRELEYFIEVGEPYDAGKDSAGNSKNKIRIILQN